MAVLVTGVAGFIGSNVAAMLLDRGEAVIGVDNLNDYYDVSLKQARLDRLLSRDRFTFHRIDVADREAMAAAFADQDGADRAVHLAAQAGVRYSLENPYAYVETNLIGHMVVLEQCRHRPGFRNLVYASSSSVYGGNNKYPSSVEDRVDRPVSLYAATKKADELMSYCYSHLYGIPQTGLRFFTVYGPWGRPDMALFLFTRAILEGKPIHVFNHGDMRRDFTYIDDIVKGVLAALDRPPQGGGEDGPPHRVYNIGNHRSEHLMDMIGLVEKELGREAEKIFEPMQPGDVKESYADIEATTRDLGFVPETSMAEGIPRFVTWYREFYKV